MVFRLFMLFLQHRKQFVDVKNNKGKQMRTKRIVLLVVCGLMAICSHAQTTRAQMSGPFCAYVPPQVAATLPVPEGAVPFYISHYGRHGSRWLMHQAQYDGVLSFFFNRNNLTKLGRSVAKRLAKVAQAARGKAGLLTPLGEQQQREIAQRMRQNYPTVFRSSATVHVYASPAKRCQQSKMAFIAGLNAANRAPIALLLHNDSIAFSWLAPTNAEFKAWKARPHKLLTLPTAHFLTALFRDTTQVNRGERLMHEFYKLAADMQNVPLKIRFDDAFNDDEWRACYERNNRGMWLLHGQAPDNQGVTQRVVAPLWQQIVDEAAQALQGKVAAALRFGHDTSLYHLLALLGTDKLSDKHADALEQIIPMAANLQIVFYCRREQMGKPLGPDDVVVKFLLNERPMRLSKVGSEDVAPDENTGYYYRWSRVLAYVAKRLAAANAQGRWTMADPLVGTAGQLQH